ncbi:uncharacterized protein LOC126887524 [Diabrotica virgifera virgifera]|uniref:Uncharacterized protein LOC114337437 n=1 Tax=Diabrotica virgifera virgifera TaxID=50390 RepID=A0A6P7GIR6_DIAVI|nr:uncharacterized protein LOC126887524 [Diabrotica virgifera virgifera]
MYKVLDEKTKNDIFSYIERTVEDANFFEYKIDFKVLPNLYRFEGERLIVSTHIKGVDYLKNKLCLDLTLKISEKCESDNVLRQFFKREQYLFQHITRFLMQLCRKRKVRYPAFPFPMCFKMFSTDDRDVLVYNNLFSMGFQPIHSRSFSPITINVILRQLAEFHALSFSAFDQCTEEFQELLSKWLPDIKSLLASLNLEDNLKTGLQVVADMLMEEKRFDLKEKMEKDLKDGFLAIANKVLSEVPEEAVIIHGDFWYHNILILYERNNPDVVKDLKFISWQMSTVHSPVLDLAYFLYFIYSEDIHQNFETYVEYYYREFCNFVGRIGSDPTKFPFLTLLDHFKRYSIMPLLVAIGGIPLITVDQLDPDNEDFEPITYSSLKDDVKNIIKKKILGILELHYKYFGD